MQGNATSSKAATDSTSLIRPETEEALRDTLTDRPATGDRQENWPWVSGVFALAWVERGF